MHLSPPDALYFPRRSYEVRIQTSGRAAPGLSDINDLIDLDLKRLSVRQLMWVGF